MNRSLRRRHRWMFVFLAVALPSVLAPALLSRRPTREMAFLPEFFGDPAPPADAVAVWDRQGLWQGLNLTTRLWQSSDQNWVELAPWDALRLPALLLYWDPSLRGGDLSDQAILLGSLDGARGGFFRLPDLSSGEGRLAIYSSAYQRIVATATIESPGVR